MKKNQTIVKKIACASATIQEDVINMCVVPVKVKHKGSNFVHSTNFFLQYSIIAAKDALSKQAS